MNELDPLDRELAAESVSARGKEIARLAEQAKKAKKTMEEFCNDLAKHVEEEIQLSNIDLVRRQATVNRIQTDSRWRRIAQCYEGVMHDMKEGMEATTNLLNAERARANAYVDLIIGRRLTLTPGEQAALKAVERETYLAENGSKNRLGAMAYASAIGRLENLNKLRQGLLDELETAKSAERATKSEFLGRVR